MRGVTARGEGDELAMLRNTCPGGEEIAETSIDAIFKVLSRRLRKPPDDFPVDSAQDHRAVRGVTYASLYLIAARSRVAAPGRRAQPIVLEPLARAERHAVRSERAPTCPAPESSGTR